ncbi:MAG TPA: TraM recognition domain-containing protein, partial [Acidimicrobiales bacterium]
VFALDEVANIAPLPSLPALAAEGAGQGLVTLACLQDLSQARARWGPEAEGFFSLFSSKVVFPGIGDQRTLSLISTLAGEHPVLMRSRTSTSLLSAILAPNSAPPTTTRSITWRPSLPPDEVARGRPGDVLCLSGTDMRWLGVVPWQRHPHWSQIADAQSGIGNELLRPVEYYYPEDIAEPEAIGPPSNTGYLGPRIVRRASDRSWVWVNDGAATIHDRFGVPQVLPSRLPAKLATAASDDGASLAVAEPGDGRRGHDPLFDEAVDGGSPESEDGLELPRGVTDPEDLRLVIVKILGPIEVKGWLSPPERALVTELLCYLALHRNQRFSGDQLRFALRPDAESELSAKTLRTYVSMLRKCLGPDYVLSGGDGYGVPWFVDTDYAFLERQGNDDIPIERNLFLLDNIRGRPFEGVPAGAYGWVFSELWISRIETTIVSMVQRFTSQCLEAGLVDKAEDCVRQGLLGVPEDLSLWELRVQVAGEFGTGALNRAKAEASAALGPDAPDLFG